MASEIKCRQYTGAATHTTAYNAYGILCTKVSFFGFVLFFAGDVEAFAVLPCSLVAGLMPFGCLGEYRRPDRVSRTSASSIVSLLGAAPIEAMRFSSRFEGILVDNSK